MKRTLFFATLAVAYVCGSLSASAQTSASAGTTSAPAASQPQSSDDSLGNYARNLRKDKKPETAKQFDNDNLPTNEKLSVVGTGDSEASASTDQNAAESSAAHTPTADEQKQANDQWKDKLADQKSKIDLLSRELDVEQREYKLRAAAMYGDAGNRLRNSAEWDKEDNDYKQQIADKQKALDEAKKKLDDMQEQARKSGVPTSDREQ